MTTAAKGAQGGNMSAYPIPPNPVLDKRVHDMQLLDRLGWELNLDGGGKDSPPFRHKDWQNPARVIAYAESMEEILELEHERLMSAARHVWDKGMLTITDGTDDDAAATLAECIGYKYERKWK
jgi:hypothetical protein